jgi:hypothetical protein
MGRDDRYRAQRDYWRERFCDLAAGVVAAGNLALLDLLDDCDAGKVRTRALDLLDESDHVAP